MGHLVKGQAGLIAKEKESRLFVAFAAFPLLLIIVRLFNTNFMQLSAESGSMDFMTFFEAVIYVQYNFALPTIALIYLVSVNVGEEIRNKILYLYKDIPKAKLLSAKHLTLIGTYGFYVLLTFLASLFTYYTSLRQEDFTTGEFIGALTWTSDALAALGIILMSIIIIYLASALSIHFSNGLTTTLAVLFYLFSLVASGIDFTRYLFPTGFVAFYNEQNAGTIILLMFLCFFVWVGILNFLAQRAYKRAEY
ncbi:MULTISPECIES: hypothetical protein [Aerococcus]|uniref:Uncharacterized protein n=1 Tax=Aerococcus sanguinicola TaxID=119206 RepID=A0A5N1GJU6_9LACT|nr:MULTISPECIES: hypothetical protein [Aerococcus]KAA9301253.1 hypothetical protein F6I03_05125 [Aerococcus sanguinicola]MDK6369211.1 hypothetical protein [Aerococcus sp. UMB9870]MDK6679035.1 hypothetical protein [Aerococcus sp. UMB8608]MDK6687417.1 hypothetical protein [Aerococcus sp. UMB8623]MDK6940097.1 hypothetical protein [Aerococcus sp. UMB8487]